jgi:hypothetical protein
MKRALALVLGSYGLLVTSIALFAGPIPAEAHIHRRAPINWNGSIEATIKPGDKQIFPVTFTASADLPEMSVIIGHKLRPYVTAASSTIGPLKKGQPATITLTVSAPIDALPSEGNGLVFLVAKTGAKHAVATPFPRPLHVEARVVWSPMTDDDLGISYLLSPRFIASRDEFGALILSQVSAAENRDDLDGSPRIEISVNENPDNLAPEDFYNGGPGVFIGTSVATGLVGGIRTLRYEPSASLAGMVVVVVPLSGKFLLIVDQGAAFQADGSFLELLKSIHFGGEQ